MERGLSFSQILRSVDECASAIYNCKHVKHNCTIFSQWKNPYKQIICPPFYKLFIIFLDICFCNVSFVRCTRICLLFGLFVDFLFVFASLSVAIVNCRCILLYWMVILFTLNQSHLLFSFVRLVGIFSIPTMRSLYLHDSVRTNFGIFR